MFFWANFEFASESLQAPVVTKVRKVDPGYAIEGEGVNNLFFDQLVGLFWLVFAVRNPVNHRLRHANTWNRGIHKTKRPCSFGEDKRGE
jgi:hypothetical protein